MVRNMNLGVAPAVGTIAAIAASILAKLAAGAVSRWMAIKATADEFRELRRLEEAGFHQLATLLARGSDTPEWEWFQILKEMKAYGMLDPGPDIPPETGQEWIKWAIVAALAISVVFVFRK